MNKKCCYLILLSIIIIGVIFNNSHQLFIWGHNSAYAFDEFNYFARVGTIYSGETDIFTTIDSSGLTTLYPSGYFIFLTSFISLTGLDIDNIFLLRFLINTIFIIIPVLIFFLIGAKADKRLGLCAAFFSIVSMSFFSHPSNNFTFISSGLNITGTGVITGIAFLIVILAITHILKSNSNFLKFSIIILLVSTVSGLSHITPYFGFLLQMIILIMVLKIITYIKKPRDRAFLNRQNGTIAMLLLSVVFVYFLYYSTINWNTFKSDYSIGALPDFINYEWLNYIVPVMMILGICSIILYFFFYMQNIKYSGSKKMFKLPLFRRLSFLLPIFAGYYVLIVVLTTRGLMNPFMHRPTVGGIFPLFFSTSFKELEVIGSQAIGLILFILALIGLYYLLRDHNQIKRFLGLSFVILYLSRLFLLFPLGSSFFYDAYIGACLMPFIYGAALIGIYESGKRGSTFFTAKSFRKIKIKRFLKISIILLIIFLFSSTSILLQFNKEPSVRDRIYPNFSFLYKANPNPPIVSTNLITAVNAFTNEGEYIIAPTSFTLTVLFAMTHIKVSSFNYWGEFNDRSNLIELRSALEGGDGLKKYVEKYHARFIVIAYNDYRGNLSRIEKFENNPNLVKVYENRFGDRIYQYVNVHY